MSEPHDSVRGALLRDRACAGRTARGRRSRCCSAVAGVIVTFSRAGFLTLAAIGLLSAGGDGPSRARRRSGCRPAARRDHACRCCRLGYIERLSTITDIRLTRPARRRGDGTTYRSRSDVAARNPVIGVGLGQNVLALNRERGPTWREVHNVYLQYAVDLGVPGLLLFLWLFVAFFRTARRVRRRPARNRRCARSAVVAGGVQIALVRVCGRGAFFHPVAYQFYFFLRRRSGAGGPERAAAPAIAVRAHARRSGMTSARRRPAVDPPAEGRADAALRRHRESVHVAQPRARRRPLPSRARVHAARGPFVSEAAERGIPLREYPIAPFRSARTLAQQARLARDIVRRRDPDRARLQLLRQRVRDSAGARRRRAGRHRVDSRLRSVPHADAEAGAAAGVPRSPPASWSTRKPSGTGCSSRDTTPRRSS